jgi:hypothetical protein
MTTEDIKGDYAVGYGKPPAHSRFKPGQSGNPAGRRKGQPSVQDLMLREAARVVKIKTGDSIENLTKHEVVVRQLWKTAMQGDLAAMRLLLTFMATAPVSASEDGPHEEASTSWLPAKPDEETVRRMLSRFAHLQADESES